MVSEMARWASRFAIFLSSIALLMLSLGWLMLSAPMFNGVRSDLLERVLSEQIGQPIVISGDVHAIPGRTSTITVTKVKIPSEGIANVNLAELDTLGLDLDTFALINGTVDFNDIRVSGLQVNLFTQQNSRTSWSKPHAALPSDSAVSPLNRTSGGNEKPWRGLNNARGKLLDFMRTRNGSFEAMRLTVKNQKTGFEFDFNLEALRLVEVESGNRLNVTSNGTVNGQKFTFEGYFPEQAPFTTLTKFGDMQLTFSGVPISRVEGGGYVADVDLQTGELGDLLEVLKLERSLEGSGTLSAKVTRQSGLLEVSDFLSTVDLANGRQLSVEGTAENLLTGQGVDIRGDLRLYPENKQPKPAKELSEFKLTNISAHIVGADGYLEFKNLLLRTNLFDQGLEDIGPVAIGEFRRTEDGKLALLDVSLQAGPPSEPILKAQGNLLHLLALKEYDIEGEILAPASLLLGELSDDAVAAFGALQVEFAFDDTKGPLRVTRFAATAVGAREWDMDGSMVLEDARNVGDLALEIDLDIYDLSKFLSALDLKRVNAGQFEIMASLHGNKDDMIANLGVRVGTSKMTTSLELNRQDDLTKINGKIHSKSLRLDDLKNALAGIVELSNIKKKRSTDRTASTVGPTRVKVQPLVLEREVQPLVLPKERPKLSEVVNFQKFLLNTELDAKIDIERLVGVHGVTSISSELVSKDGKAQFGPLNVAYGGGFLRAQAGLDLVKSPNLVSVSGSTGGWDFGKILDSVGLGVQAYGILGGRFNLTGDRRSLDAFVNSMRGSVSVNMYDGEIATSLLELAGLGIFPWLFSEEFRKKRTKIQCISAPIQIRDGKVIFDSVVAETNRVQLVARGSLDWKRDTISIRAVPRPVGRPLSRSAWPFDVSGSFSKPEFKLIVGGLRSRRLDDANRMPIDRKPCNPDILQLQ